MGYDEFKAAAPRYILNNSLCFYTRSFSVDQTKKKHTKFIYVFSWPDRRRGAVDAAV